MGNNQILFTTDRLYGARGHVTIFTCSRMLSNFESIFRHIASLKSVDGGQTCACSHLRLIWNQREATVKQHKLTNRLSPWIWFIDPLFIDRHSLRNVFFEYKSDGQCTAQKPLPSHQSSYCDVSSKLLIFVRLHIWWIHIFAFHAELMQKRQYRRNWEYFYCSDE